MKTFWFRSVEDSDEGKFKSDLDAGQIKVHVERGDVFEVARYDGRGTMWLNGKHVVAFGDGSD